MTKAQLEEQLEARVEHTVELVRKLDNRQKVIDLQEQVIANLKEQKENAEAFIDKVKGLWEK